MSEHNSGDAKNARGYQDVMRSIDDFFHQTYRKFQAPPLFAQSIPVRTQESLEAFVILAELPGVDKQLIRLEALPHALAIRVMSNESSEQSVEKERLISIPFVYSEKEIKAAYKDGLLRITIKRERQSISID